MTRNHEMIFNEKVTDVINRATMKLNYPVKVVPIYIPEATNEKEFKQILHAAVLEGIDFKK